jgi:alkaline phosphatase D
MSRADETIGPMTAHLTATTGRVWLRAGKALLEDGRPIAARLYRNGGAEVLEQRAFSFAADFDNVGLVEFGSESPLAPDTRYEYAIGFAGAGDGFEPLRRGAFTTFSNDAGKAIAFVTGSCRHLYIGKREDLRDADEALDYRDGVHYGDRAFKTISELPDLKPDFMVMSGDQVYCDHEEGAFFPGHPARSLPEYLDNYHRAYPQPYFAGLAARMPFYMAMDDHEIKNDWRMDMIRPESDPRWERNREQYRNGLRAYLAYQAALSPVVRDCGAFGAELARLADASYEENLPAAARPYEDRSKGLHYTFAHGPARVFCLDVRLERYRELEPGQMIGAVQEAALKDWLLEHRSGDTVKFVVSAVPVFPDTRWIFGASEDKWGGFCEQRTRILDFIRENGIRKVVFVSGDVHVSLAARLAYRGQDMYVYSVVSSAFTWPIPGLQRFNFDWGKLAERSKRKSGKPVPDTASRGDYEPVELTRWKPFKTGHREHNFCYLKTDGSKLTIQYYKARNGERFESIEVDLGIR